MGSWSCPHEDKGSCTRRDAACRPGGQGCVLGEREGRDPSDPLPGLGEWLEALASPAPTPAGGALAFVTLAGAAALAAKAARAGGGAPGRFVTWMRTFLAGAAEDARGYPEAAAGPPEARVRFLVQGLERLEGAVDFAEELAELAARVRGGLGPDVAAAARLAREAVGVLAQNLAYNLEAWAVGGAWGGERTRRFERLRRRFSPPGGARP